MMLHIHNLRNGGCWHAVVQYLPCLCRWNSCMLAPTCMPLMVLRHVSADVVQPMLGYQTTICCQLQHIPDQPSHAVLLSHSALNICYISVVHLQAVLRQPCPDVATSPLPQPSYQ